MSPLLSDMYKPNALLIQSSPRRDRGGGRRGGGGGGGGGGGSGAKAPVERRVFLSNIPFEMKWQEVKDLFRDEVGEVDYGMFNILERHFGRNFVRIEQS